MFRSCLRLKVAQGFSLGSLHPTICTGLQPLGYALLSIRTIPALALLLITPPQPPILHLVDAHYNHLTSLRTRYTERYTGMGQTRTESGTLLLKKPGRMAWHYDTPAGKLFLLDGHSAWFYTPGDPQAQRIPAKQLDDLRSPLRFLLGHTQLERELDTIAVTLEGPNYRITGIPKDQSARLKQLTLRVTATGLITEMTLEEPDGATTQFVFTETQENIPTKDTDFVFAPPPGVAIVSGTPPL